MILDGLRGRVRELRAGDDPQSRSARALSAAAEPEPAVVGCWVSPGWSAALTVDGHEDWLDVAIPDGGSGVGRLRRCGAAASAAAGW
jgi:hypothetical protein